MRPINADAAIDAFDNQTWERLDIPICKEIRNAAKETIRRLPTIDAVPVRHAKLLNAHPYGECSNCGQLIDARDKFNYCPNCGARMDAERKEE